MKVLNKPARVLLLIFICISLFNLTYSQNPLKEFRFQNDKKSSITLPFKLINNLIVIQVSINNSDSLNFILDTGVTTSILTDIEGIDSIILNYVREINLRGLGKGDDIKAIHSYGNEIGIGELIGRNQDIFILNDAKLKLSTKLGFPVHGILGFTVFSNYIVYINYDRMLITFYKSDKFKYSGKYRRFKTLQFTFHDSKPYINLEMIDHLGKSFIIKLLMDTGASHTIWLDPGSMISGLKIPEKTTLTYLGTGLNGDIYGHLGRMSKVILDGSVLNDVIISFPDSSSISKILGSDGRNGSVGSEILKRFNMLIDFPNNKLLIKPNSHFHNSFNQNMSGMELITPIPEYRHYVISEVRANSPADKAGLRAGDIIEMINYIRTIRFSLSEIYEIFQSSPGKKLIIQYQRDGKYFTTSLKLEKYI